MQKRFACGCCICFTSLDFDETKQWKEEILLLGKIYMIQHYKKKTIISLKENERMNSFFFVEKSYLYGFLILFYISDRQKL